MTSEGDIVKETKLLLQQEAQLPQRDGATLYVSWHLVNCCIAVRKITFERFAVDEWPWASLKVIRIAVYHFLLVVCSNSKTDVTPAILSRDFVAQLYLATKSQVWRGVSRNFSTVAQLLFRSKMRWTLIGQFLFMRQSCSVR